MEAIGFQSISMAKTMAMVMVMILAVVIFSANGARATRVGPTAGTMATLSVLRRPTSESSADPQAELINQSFLHDVDDMDAEKEEDLGGLHRTIAAAALTMKSEGDGLEEDEDEPHFVDAAQWVHEWISRQIKRQYREANV